MLGHPASWHTVCRPSDLTSDWSCLYSGPILARVLIHSGLRSIGVSALRTSRRSSLRPSAFGAGAGACVTSANCTPGAQPGRHWRTQYGLGHDRLAAPPELARTSRRRTATGPRLRTAGRLRLAHGGGLE